MKKTYLVAGGIVILILLITYLIFQNTASAPSESTSETAALITNGESDRTSETMSSFKDFIGMGSAFTCTYGAQSTDGGQGVLYASNGKMRIDFSEGVGGNPQTGSGSVIIDGSYQYMWDERSKEGMKMSLQAFDAVDPSDDASVPKETSAPNYAELMQTYQDTDCKPWSVDPSKFVPPTDMSFTDYGQMLQQMQGLFDPTTQP